MYRRKGQPSLREFRAHLAAFKKQPRGTIIAGGWCPQALFLPIPRFWRMDKVQIRNSRHELVKRFDAALKEIYIDD